MNSGNYTATGIYDGSLNINGISVMSNYFVVSKDSVDFNVLTNVTGKNATIIVNFTNYTGLISIEINNNTYDVDVIDGNGFLILINLTIGNYSVNIDFNDANYNPLTKNVNFTISDENYILNTNDLVMFYKNGKFIATLTDSFNNPTPNKTITFKVNGVNYNKIN